MVACVGDQREQPQARATERASTVVADNLAQESFKAARSEFKSAHQLESASAARANAGDPSQASGRTDQIADNRPTTETNVNTKQHEGAGRSGAAPTGAPVGADPDANKGEVGKINEATPRNSFAGNARELLRWVAIFATAAADGFAHRMAPRDYMSAYPFLYDGDPARGQNLLTMIRKGQWDEAVKLMKYGSEVPDEELFKIQQMVRQGDIDKAHTELEKYKTRKNPPPP